MRTVLRQPTSSIIRRELRAGRQMSWIRDAAPSLNHWVHRDPAGYVDGANLYQFVTSNPTTRLDPSGLEAKKVPDCTVIVVLADYSTLKDHEIKPGNCSSFGALGCWTDVVNYQPDGTPNPGLIPNFPKGIDAPIGPGPFDPNHNPPTDVNEGYGVNNDKDNYNGGRGPGQNSFLALIKQALAAADEQARQLAEAKKCDCKEIIVRIDCADDKARETGQFLGKNNRDVMPKDWTQKGGSLCGLEKRYPVKK